MLNWQLPVKCSENPLLWQESYTAFDYKLTQTARKTAQVCSKCGTTESPEWRCGPMGPRTLCNRCGLRYAREEAQKIKCIRIMAVRNLVNEETSKFT